MNLMKAGLTKADVAEALREREFGDIAEVRLAVMEPDGQVNVLSKSEPDGATSPAPA